jgi:hypothetical protein
MLKLIMAFAAVAWLDASLALDRVNVREAERAYRS